MPLPDEIRGDAASDGGHVRDDITPQVRRRRVAVEKEHSVRGVGRREGGVAGRVEVAHGRAPHIDAATRGQDSCGARGEQGAIARGGRPATQLITQNSHTLRRR
jgi:hypothetical protein